MRVVVIFTVCLLIAASAFGQIVYVSVDVENLRDAPRGKIIAKVFKGQELVVLDRQGKWSRIISSEHDGWIWTASTSKSVAGYREYDTDYGNNYEAARSAEMLTQMYRGTTGSDQIGFHIILKASPSANRLLDQGGSIEEYRPKVTQCVLAGVAPRLVWNRNNYSEKKEFIVAIVILLRTLYPNSSVYCALLEVEDATTLAVGTWEIGEGASYEVLE